MAKTKMIRVRVEPEIKSQAEEIFSELGLSPTEAITLFYTQVTLHRGLPFAVGIPNAETIGALRQVRAGEGLTEYDDLDALKTKHD
ncbi:MAG: type II toxin-antitoxin system RelB/DinJ family antitoxin [Gemmatimonadetes bacterium]|nr:type II toxin-antitoxin system RelB/DinJ family antitoxin [Gemmatimonadota bacterium]